MYIRSGWSSVFIFTINTFELVNVDEMNSSWLVPVIEIYVNIVKNNNNNLHGLADHAWNSRGGGEDFFYYSTSPTIFLFTVSTQTSTMAGVASTLAKKRALAAGFGTNANASKYLNQDFQSLRSECLRKGSIFTDCTFPAAPESLGFKELGPNTSKTRGVQWKRPGVSYCASYTLCIYAWLKCLLYD